MKVRQTLLVCPFEESELEHFVKGGNAEYVVDMLRGFIKRKLNIVVFGDAGTGSATFAKALYQTIPYDESIVCLSTTEFAERVKEAGQNYSYLPAVWDGSDLANLITTDYAKWITSIPSSDIDSVLCELKQAIQTEYEDVDFEKCVADNLDILIEVNQGEDGQRFIKINEMRRNFDGDISWYAPIVTWDANNKQYRV